MAYISREQIIKHIEEFYEKVPLESDDRHLIAGFKAYIENLPTVDVVEVVRCRNCKHHHWEQEPCHGKTEHFCSVLKAQVFADFYCYHGAKMDGGKTE